MPKSIKKTPVDAKKLSLEQWLTLLARPADKQPALFHNFSFPTDQHLLSYLDTIAWRSDKEIKLLLRNFLFMGGGLGADEMRFKYFAAQDNILELIDEHEFIARLFDRRRHTWEGMSWIIDLLPHQPATAIAAIEAYQLAHLQILPDGRIHGLSDAVAIVRAKYLNAVTQRSLLDCLSPREFELLIAALFQEEGLSVAVTKRTRDGGYDVVATRESIGVRDRRLIECKHGYSTVGVRVVRSLRGVLDTQRAARGIVITTAQFTHSALQFAEEDGRLELVAFDELCRRLNAAFGTNWIRTASLIITSVMAEIKEAGQAPIKLLPSEHK